MLVKLLNYTALKNKSGRLLQCMGIEWEDCKLSIFEDMTRESAMMRKQFTAVWKLTWDHKISSSNFTVALSEGKKAKFCQSCRSIRYIKEHIQLQRGDKQEKN